jgi:hypothetical protein
VFLNDVPSSGIPRDEGIDVAVAAVDPLVVEAQEFVANQRIKQSVEKLIERKSIDASKLPYPIAVPQGRIQLRTDLRTVRLGKKVFTRVDWSMQVPAAVSNEFTYHVFVAHYLGENSRGTRHGWGIASTQLNEQEHSISSDSVASQIGEHRLLAILTAWSIKTEQVHILAVTESDYIVTSK